MAICVFAVINKRKPNVGLPKYISENNYYYLLVGIVFLLAVVLRVYKFGSVPGGFNQDGAMAAVDANALAQYGTDRFGMKLPVHFTAWGYGQMSVLLSYLMVPFIKLFGLSPITARLPMLIVSLIGIYVLYRFIFKSFGKAPALIALIFIVINPWHIMQSRWALDCNLLPHFLLFSVYALYLGIYDKKKIFLYVSMVLFALTMYTYGIALYAIPIMLIALCIYLAVKKLIRVRDIFICAGIYLLFAWPILAMVFINFFKLNSIHAGPFTIPFFPDSVRTNDILLFSDNFGVQLVSNLRSLVDVVFLQAPDLPWNTIPEFGIMYLFSLPFSIAGMIFTYRKFREKTASAQEKSGRIFLIIWMGVALLSGLIINNVNVNRINIILYPMAIFTALGIYYSLFEVIRKRAITVIVAAVFAVSAMSFTAQYFGEHNKELSVMFFDGFGEAVEYAEDMNTETIYVTTNTQYETSKDVSEIMTMFYSKIDARYYQGKKDVYNNAGELLKPYKERYIYTTFYHTVTPEDGAAYIFNSEEQHLFDPELFHIKLYGGYGVAVGK